MTPLGYDAKDRKITVNATEAERVRTIFRGYLKLGSLNLLMADLRKRGIFTKVRKLNLVLAAFRYSDLPTWLTR
jgi:site-specific DNA recombinase